MSMIVENIILKTKSRSQENNETEKTQSNDIFRWIYFAYFGKWYS